MTTAREKLIPKGKPGIYHCRSRVVRRAYLMGDDPFSGRNYDHRKQWVKSRLRDLVNIFGIEICGYSIMINHTHIILSVRPDVSGKWTDREVAYRWLALFPKKALEYVKDPEHVEIAIDLMISENGLIDEFRNRLTSVSWFMRCLNEYIARRANREDGCTGRFWEGRFKSTALLDDSAVLACLVYVDLNPIRAGVASAPEDSEFTSAQDRIIARQARIKLNKLNETGNGSQELTAAQSEIVESVKREVRRDAWLSPFGRVLEGKSKTFLNMELDEYLELLDWTGRQIKEGKKGRIPPNLENVLTRLEIEAEEWLFTVLSFGNLFYRVAGKVKSIIRSTRTAGQKWLRGKPIAKVIFG